MILWFSGGAVAQHPIIFQVIFTEYSVQTDGFTLPTQHSPFHYSVLIRAFGTPNGLCSSITESTHIKAVKKPWHCSNHFKALGQKEMHCEVMVDVSNTRNKGSCE